MKETEAQKVFVGELFFDLLSRQFYRRVEHSEKFCNTKWHIAAETAKDGTKKCFMPETKVVV